MTAWIPAVLLAATLAGVTLPDREGDLVLNGLGLREATFLRIDVYVAGLYLPEKTKDPRVALDPARPKHLVMHFVRDVGRDDIVKAWRDGFSVTAPRPSAETRASLDTLVSWTADVVRGEEMAFRYVPGEGLAVRIKGEEKGTLRGAEFARAFFLLWLGPDVPYPDLKAGLLGT